MIILFSNCGFAIIAFLFYLCGSNRVAEVFADFIVNNCYLIFAVLLIINFLISVCHNDVLNSIISLLVIPLDLMFISCICVVPTFILRLKYAEYGNILNICLVMALDLFFTILFVILIRLLIAESFLTTYSIISSNEWWENILNIARK